MTKNIYKWWRWRWKALKHKENWFIFFFAFALVFNDCVCLVFTVVHVPQPSVTSPGSQNKHPLQDRILSLSNLLKTHLLVWLHFLVRGPLVIRKDGEGNLCYKLQKTSSLFFPSMQQQTDLLDKWIMLDSDLHFHAIVPCHRAMPSRSCAITSIIHLLNSAARPKVNPFWLRRTVHTERWLPRWAALQAGGLP